MYFVCNDRRDATNIKARRRREIDLRRIIS